MRHRLKGALRSRTIWFNAVALPMLATMFDQAQANLPVLQPWLPADRFQAIAVVSVVGNIVLRGLTTRGLEHK